MNKTIRKITTAGIIAALMAGMLPGTGSVPTAEAASKSQLQNRLAELKSARAEANAAVKALEGEAEKYSEKIAALDYQIQSTRAQLNTTQKIIDTLTEDIEEKQVELDETVKELDDKQELFETRIRVMYENGDTTYMEVLLSSENFSDMLSHMEIVSQIMDYDKKVVEEYKALKLSIEQQKASLESDRKEQQDYADDLKVAYEEIEAQKKEYKALKAKVDSNIELKKAEAERMLREQEQINDEIAELSRQEAAAASSSGGGGGGKVYSGSMTWPCPSYNRISSPYGYRTHPISGTRKLHKGLDISASSGNPVIAAASGTVVKSYFSSSYGNYVVISHGGGVMTAYAHMTRRLVSVGQRVAAGQQVGTVGSTGNSTGPHLHFEVYVGGSTVNPMNYFN
ncbi:MAG: peptidoglycan DD-metalloendopeptidase family protein [Butyricicoccus pullicaecorum]|nr:peptidoglycan DD-metalloendopeptidase family protein [Butyricicoccus pullicaecorum]